MTYTVRTGGSVEFRYTKEALKRIESEDTQSTKEFKKALREWRKTGKLPKKKKQVIEKVIDLDEINRIAESIKKEELESKNQPIHVKEETFLDKSKKVIKEKYHKVKNWLKGGPNSRFNWSPLLVNLLWITVLIIIFAIIYHNLEKLNQIVILFIKLGASLLLINLYLLIKYSYELFESIKHLISIQRRWMKYLLVILLLLLLLHGYNNRDTLFDPVIDYYNETDFSIFSPFGFPETDSSSNNSSYQAEQDDVETSSDADKTNDSFLERITGAFATDVFTTDPERKEECKEAFDYVNQLRKANGLEEIEWDDRVYDLGIHRTRDMYDRNYFDHVTPDGECVKDFKDDYGLWDYTIAENCGAMYSGYSATSFTSYIDPMEQVDGWMDSRGHRYNLLYPDHEIGAISCYYGVCVFLGGNTDSYGLGAGSCTTGDEGLEFWNSVEKQPGEI